MASDTDRILAVLADIRDRIIAGVRLDVHQHSDSAVLSMLTTIIDKENIMAGELAKLTQEVAETKSVMQSAKALIVGLKEKLDAAGTDPAALAALSAELDASQNDLAAAIAANTPAAPTPIALPDAVMGQPYSATLEAIAGAAPFTNSIAGAPSWLVAESSAPLLSGTPDQIGGPFVFEWTSTDSDPETPNVTRTYSIRVV